ncbi:MAG: hypothetical protein DCE90_16715 [Pseudanabaena sp.]|nr:MAG: hypothetical protein DCE90_16715 [Pseudanabaena sp.]
MKLNGFSVTIAEGKETSDGYVQMKHGTQYTILLQNESNRRCDAEVYLDDQQVGIWRINPFTTARIERPVHDHGRFTFYQVGTSEAIQAGISRNSSNGLVRVLFKPERQQISVESAKMSRAAMAGGTGLSGHSDQEFTTVAALDYSPQEFVTINLRLISVADEPRPLFASTPVPPPVGEVTEPKPQPPRKAMTWTVLNMVILNGKTYALFGSDASTNPYHGDTDTNAVLPLLGIKKMGLPTPAGLYGATRTNGGAMRGTWSGGKAIVVPDVQGNSLTSQEIADLQCRLQGLKVLGEDGFRMAEFHDGDRSAGIAGWDFWADASAIETLQISGQRYWVSINDQSANPWG